MTLPRPDFRFGINLTQLDSRSSWASRVAEVEDLGFDVLQVADHLGMPAPLPLLTSAAELSSTLTLGTFVLNTPLYRPWMLARDVAALQILSGGRLELGLGTGYIPAEYESAGLPFPSPGQRVDRLEQGLTEVQNLLGKCESGPPAPAIMLAGAGQRMLTLAAERADIVGFPIHAGISPDVAPDDALGRRVELVREVAGERFEQLELNLFVAGVARDIADLDLSLFRMLGQSDEQLAELPGLLIGTPQQIAERLLRYREDFGISYISVLEPHLRAFAPVMDLLR